MGTNFLFMATVSCLMVSIMYINVIIWWYLSMSISKFYRSCALLQSQYVLWWRMSRCSVCFLYSANDHLSLHVCMSKISLSCQTHDINPIKMQGPLYLWYGSSGALSCNMHVLLHTVTSGALVYRLWQPVYFT